MNVLGYSNEIMEKENKREKKNTLNVFRPSY